ncbi:extensin [Iris pallida]|uniref:Extensin n=1 Tax=Iris pallida TaxID=29817 RepID=A0AAX6GBQ7_IRIPA|nr:extensin [Iris pallida]
MLCVVLCYCGGDICDVDGSVGVGCCLVAGVGGDGSGGDHGAGGIWWLGLWGRSELVRLWSDGLVAVERKELGRSFVAVGVDLGMNGARGSDHRRWPIAWRRRDGPAGGARQRGWRAAERERE